MVVIMIKRGVSTERFENIRYQILGDVALDVVDSIKERCLQLHTPIWISKLLQYIATIYCYNILLQYISFYFNINIATFVNFQIAVYVLYVVLRTFTCPSSPS